MSAFDLVVRGGMLVLPDGVRRADLGVSDGAIAAIADELPGGRAEIVATGLHVLPGGLDPHVHFNEPGRTHWEGFATGTAALAAGGMTACFDMPLNSHPPTTDGAGFDAKLAAARASARVDFGLWGGLVPGNLDCLEELFERGVVGFKAFMSASGVDDFHAADNRTLYDGMALCARLGALVAVHAENDALTSGARTGLSARDYAASRPPIAEIEALGPVAKCAPPLRDPAPLWERLDAIALVASDHSPSPPELKDPDDYFFAWGGIAGAQTTLPLLLGATDPATVARLTSAGAAERFRIAGKGRLEVGLDADLELGEHVLWKGALDIVSESA